MYLSKYWRIWQRVEECCQRKSCYHSSLHPRNIRINIFPVNVMKGVSSNELFLEQISSKISNGSYILYVHNISKKRKQLKKS